MVRIIILLCLLNSIQSFAQQEDIIFHPVSEGLSQHSASSLLQDSKGFLWVGTRQGLNRYDGVHFKSYQQSFKDSTSLSNSIIQCLMEDNEGNIWIGTYGGGLNLYHYQEDRFYSFRHNKKDPNSLSDDFVMSIFEDFSGNIWVGTENGGLNRFNKSQGTFKRFLSNEADPQSISSNNISAINQDDNGNLWIGTYGGGVNLFNTDKHQFIHFTNQNTQGLENDIIRTIYKTDEGTLIFGTHNGPKKLVYEKSQYFFKNLIEEEKNQQLINNVRVLSISEDAQHRTWVGTENKGLFCIDNKLKTTQHFYHTTEHDFGMQSNSIWSLLEDKHGTLWIGTYNSGLFKVDPYEKKFNSPIRSGPSVYDLSHNVVSAFAEDSQGNIWIGTDGGGLNYYNRSSKKIKKYTVDKQDDHSLSNNAVVSILVDKANNLWVGTWEGGINFLPDGENEFQHFLHKELENSPSGNDIYDLYEDSKGRIWVAAFREGLDVYLPEEGQFHSLKKDNISNLKIRSIYEDHQGYMWIGMEGAGIDKIKVDEQLNIIYHKQYFKNYSDTTGLLNNTVTYIYEDSDSTLWIGTEGGGLHVYNREKDTFSPLTNDLFVKSNVIYGILEDESKHLWLSTNNGLVRYDKTNKTIETFTKIDGLQSSEFYKSACLKTSDGNLLFGGVQGFNMFHPESVNKNPVPPQTYITKFLLSDQEIKPGKDSPLTKNILNTESIELNHEQNDFSFEFAALNFSQPEKNTYQYKLENYNKNWISVDTRNTAYYANVPPGDYVFKVKSSNNDGLWSTEIAAINIFIDKPWYATYWAYSFYLLLFVAGLVWARQTIVHRERLKAKLKLEHMELTKMQELDQMKSRFFANISHEFRTPLTLIISPLKSLYLDEVNNKFRRQIGMMIRNAERLLKLINQILDLSKLESGKMGLNIARKDIVAFLKPIIYSFDTYADKQYVTYKVELPKAPVFVYFDSDKVEKIVTNLISNAIKFTPEFGHVGIQLTATEEYMELIVADSGIGIPKDKVDYIFNRYYRAVNEGVLNGTGIGLALTNELVELHKGKIEVFTTEGVGTSFTVKLPLGSTHFEESDIHRSHEPEIKTPSYNYVEISDSTELLEGQVDADKSEDDHPVILIAEDNHEMRAFICSYLEINYKIIECSNGQEAIEVAQEQIPDIVISDIMMPAVDGYTLCNTLKNNEKTSHIPVILLSAKASNESMEKGLELGAVHYVTKPFNPKLLELRIKNILDNRKMFKEQVLNNKTINLEPEHLVISSADEQFIKRAVHFVEENMDNSELQVEDLCKHMGLSKIQLYRKLKGLIGQSANEFIRTIRLKRAAQLLKHQQYTISEITYKVGFNDLQYFRQCFKKQYGTNPSEFQ